MSSDPAVPRKQPCSRCGSTEWTWRGTPRTGCSMCAVVVKGQKVNCG